MNKKLREMLISMGMNQDASDVDARSFAKENGINIVDMSNNDNSAPQVDAEKIRKQAIKSEQARVKEIQSCRKFASATQIDKAIEDGTSVDEFRKEVMANFKMPETVQVRDASLGLSKKDKEQFSFLRAINAMSNPTNVKIQEAAKFEREVSEAACEKLGRSANGFFVPTEILQHKRDLSIGGTGSNIVDEKLETGSFIEMLHNAMITRELGVRVMNFNGPVDIPAKTAGTTGYWIATEGGDITAESQPTLSQISLDRKTVGSYTDITRKLLKDASMSAEQLVRSDLALTLALMLDKAVFDGSGAAGQPEGILNTTGIGSVDWAVANAPTFANIVAMETEVATDNALSGSLSYALPAVLAGKLKTTLKSSGVAGYIFEDGMINGYPAKVTNQLAASQAIFGNWNDCIVANYGGIELNVDKAALALSGGLRVIALQDTDIGIRHAQSFCEGSNA